MKDTGKIFLLTWKFFTSKVIREFTLTSAPSFGKPDSFYKSLVTLVEPLYSGYARDNLKCPD